MRTTSDEATIYEWFHDEIGSLQQQVEELKQDVEDRDGELNALEAAIEKLIAKALQFQKALEHITECPYRGDLPIEHRIALKALGES